MPIPVPGRRTAILLAALAVVVLGMASWCGWPHLRFWWLFDPLGKNGQGLAEYRHRQLGIAMARVPDLEAESGDLPWRNWGPRTEGREGLTGPEG